MEEVLDALDLIKNKKLLLYERQCQANQRTSHGLGENIYRDASDKLTFGGSHLLGWPQLPLLLKVSEGLTGVINSCGQKDRSQDRGLTGDRASAPTLPLSPR